MLENMMDLGVVVGRTGPRRGGENTDYERQRIPIEHKEKEEKKKESNWKRRRRESMDIKQEPCPAGDSEAQSGII